MKKLQKISCQHITLDYFSWLFVLEMFGILVLSAISVSSTAIGWRIYYVDGILKFSLLILECFVFLFAVLFLPVRKTVSLLVRTFLLNPMLALFFGVALTGSVIARFIWHHPTSYLSQSIMIGVFFCTGFILLSVPEIVWEKTKVTLVKVFGLMGVLAYFAVLKNVINDFNQSGHIIAVLLVQLWVLVFLFVKGIKRTLFLIIIFLGVGLTFKNTAMLLLLVSVLGTAWFSNSVHSNVRFRRIMPIIIGFGVVFFIFIGALFYIQTRTLFSDGNTTFRYWIWEQQIQAFLKSPLYGQLFTAETAIEFGLYKVKNSELHNLVPTHNDWLDILVQGGIITFVLFFLAYIKPISGLLRLRKKQNISGVEKRLIIWSILTLINFAIAFTFNPFLMNPDISYILWFVLAFALVLEYRTRTRLRYCFYG